MSKYKPKLKALPERFQPGIIRRMDGREKLTARLSATFNSVVQDAGGIDTLPYAKLCLAERFAFLQEFLQQIEAELVTDPVGKEAMLGRWTQAVNSMTGLAKVLGMPRSRAGGPQDWIDSLYDEDDGPDTPANAPGLPSKGVQAKGP